MLTMQFRRASLTIGSPKEADPLARVEASVPTLFCTTCAAARRELAVGRGTTDGAGTPGGVFEMARSLRMVLKPSEARALTGEVVVVVLV